MLTLTPDAATVINKLRDGSELAVGAGLRIAAEPEDLQTLNLSMANEPTSGDHVVENQGAKVFLESNAATMLDTMILDAEVDDEGSVQFFLGSQEGSDGSQAADEAE